MSGYSKKLLTQIVNLELIQIHGHLLAVDESLLRQDLVQVGTVLSWVGRVFRMSSVTVVLECTFHSGRWLAKFCCILSCDWIDEWMLQEDGDVRSLAWIKLETVAYEVCTDLVKGCWDWGWYTRGLNDGHYGVCIAPVLGPGRLTGDHLYDAAAKTPHIALRCALPMLDYLRCHPERRPMDGLVAVILVV